MRLYVCYGTFGESWHPCAKAHRALVDAGHEPEVKRAYGWGRLPKALNPPPRHEVARLSGDHWVPILVLDDGTVVDGSEPIIDWAKAHPAS